MQGREKFALTENGKVQAKTIRESNERFNQSIAIYK